MNLHQHAKNQFLPFVHSSDRVNYRVPSHDWPHPLLTTPTPKIFNVLLTCMNLYHHAKNQLVLEIQSTLESGDHIYYIYYGEIEIYYISFRNYAIWLAEIWNKIFPKYRICTGTQQIINKFIIKRKEYLNYGEFNSHTNKKVERSQRNSVLKMFGHLMWKFYLRTGQEI